MLYARAVQLDNFMTQHYPDSLVAIDSVDRLQMRSLCISHYRNNGAAAAGIPHRISMMQFPYPFQFSFPGYEVQPA